MKTYYYSISEVEDILSVSVVESEFWKENNHMSDSPDSVDPNYYEMIESMPGIEELMESELEADPEIYKTKRDLKNYLDSRPEFQFNWEFDYFRKQSSVIYNYDDSEFLEKLKEIGDKYYYVMQEDLLAIVKKDYWDNNKSLPKFPDIDVLDFQIMESFLILRNYKVDEKYDNGSIFKLVPDPEFDEEDTIGENKEMFLDNPDIFKKSEEFEEFVKNYL